MTSIISKVRNLIEDNSTVVQDIFTYGSSNIFTLTESNPIAISTVYINNVLTTGYTYSSITKKVTITASITSGDTIEIDYTAYQDYSDTEIRGYINSSLYYLAVHNYDNFEVESGDNIYPTPTNEEEKLIALIASLLINPNNKTIRLPDLTISVPQDEPTDKKIGKLIGSFKRNSGVFELL